jgi:hypothetical protein
MYQAGCQNLGAVLLLSLLLAGCTSTPSFDVVEFEQWTTANASKRFIFSVPYGGRDSPQAPVGVEEAEDLLAAYMSETGYCSDGFFVYARNFSGPRYRLEGECQESSD